MKKNRNKKYFVIYTEKISESLQGSAGGREKVKNRCKVAASERIHEKNLRIADEDFKDRCSSIKSKG